MPSSDSAWLPTLAAVVNDAPFLAAPLLEPAESSASPSNFQCATGAGIETAAGGGGGGGSSTAVTGSVADRAVSECASASAETVSVSVASTSKSVPSKASVAVA